MFNVISNMCIRETNDGTKIKFRKVRKMVCEGGVKGLGAPGKGGNEEKRIKLKYRR